MELNFSIDVRETDTPAAGPRGCEGGAGPGHGAGAGRREGAGGGGGLGNLDLVALIAATVTAGATAATVGARGVGAEGQEVAAPLVCIRGQMALEAASEAIIGRRRASPDAPIEEF